MGDSFVVQNTFEVFPINAAVIENHHRKSGTEKMWAIVLVNDNITRMLKHMIVQFLEDAAHLFLWETVHWVRLATEFDLTSDLYRVDPTASLSKTVLCTPWESRYWRATSTPLRKWMV